MQHEQTKMKKIRKEKGYSQAKVAKETGIPLRTLKRYEQGGNIGYLCYLKRLANYYDVAMEELVDNS